VQLGLGPWGGDPRGATESLRRIVAQAVSAERLGFDSVWIPESHFVERGAFPAPLLLLASIAARTARIRLGTTSYLLPVRHPVRVAEDVAVLDHLSGGRVILGIGRGFRAALFEAFEVPLSEKRDRFEAILARILAAWHGEAIAEGDGRPIRVTPRPLQRPHPPIWVAAFGPKALTQAGRLGLPYLASPMETLDRLEENYARHREAREAAGFQGPDPTVPVIRTAFATRDPALAQRVRDALEAQLRLTARQVGGPARRAAEAEVDEWALIGEPERVGDEIERYRERIGLSHLIVRGQLPVASPADLETSLELIASLRASRFAP
jgi:alkanesulfonate monooxygenase SsuD/methylene tetrahydromethanopterin reductase-like flavin-dependent oxidoreductase (luciferase family)